MGRGVVGRGRQGRGDVGLAAAAAAEGLVEGHRAGAAVERGDVADRGVFGRRVEVVDRRVGGVGAGGVGAEGHAAAAAKVAERSAVGRAPDRVGGAGDRVGRRVGAGGHRAEPGRGRHAPAAALAEEGDLLGRLALDLGRRARRRVGAEQGDARGVGGGALGLVEAAAAVRIAEVADRQPGRTLAADRAPFALGDVVRDEQEGRVGRARVGRWAADAAAAALVREELSARAAGEGPDLRAHRRVVRFVRGRRRRRRRRGDGAIGVGLDGRRRGHLAAGQAELALGEAGVEVGERRAGRALAAATLDRRAGGAVPDVAEHLGHAARRGRRREEIARHRRAGRRALFVDEAVAIVVEAVAADLVADGHPTVDVVEVAGLGPLVERRAARAEAGAAGHRRTGPPVPGVAEDPIAGPDAHRVHRGAGQIARAAVLVDEAVAIVVDSVVADLAGGLARPNAEGHVEHARREREREPHRPDERAAGPRGPRAGFAPAAHGAPPSPTYARRRVA